jgi:hypothetical protein
MLGHLDHGLGLVRTLVHRVTEQPRLLADDAARKTGTDVMYCFDLANHNLILIAYMTVKPVGSASE